MDDLPEEKKNLEVHRRVCAGELLKRGKSLHGISPTLSVSEAWIQLKEDSSRLKSSADSHDLPILPVVSSSRKDGHLTRAELYWRTGVMRGETNAFRVD